MEKDKLVARAKDVVDKILYLTIATTNQDGEPWNSPVYCAFDDAYSFYWASWQTNHHSQNIAKNGRVFAVIYDSRVPEGTGFGVYFKGTAVALSNPDEIAAAVKLLATRKEKQPRDAQEFLEKYPRRIYKFVPRHIWVNDEDRVNGNYVDTRVEITDGLLKRSL